MTRIQDDEQFIRKVESLIDPAETSDLVFFASLKNLLPRGVFKRILYRTSKKFPRIGFVIEPYCLFLFFTIRDIEKAQSCLPDRYRLARARIFAEDEPNYYFGMGIFNTRASTFWGSRLETYLIAKDTATGITSWIFMNILSDTIIAHPKSGIADPNCSRALYTTNSRGELFLDFMHKEQPIGLSLKGNLTRGRLRPLEQDLWIMGNASIAHAKTLGGENDDPFSVIFDPAEVAAALDLPPDDLRIFKNTLLFDFVEPDLRKAVCFPYAQHYIADSPGQRTFVKDPEDMVAKYNEIAKTERLATFSAGSLKKQMLIWMAIPLFVSIILSIALMAKY